MYKLYLENDEDVIELCNLFCEAKGFSGIYSLVGERPTTTVHISNLQKNNTIEF